MNRQYKLIISIILLIIVTIFALQNTNNVNVDLFFVNFETPLVLVILFSLLIGVIIGLIGGAMSSASKNKEIKQLRKELQQEKDMHQANVREKDTKIANLRADLEEAQLKERNTTAFDNASTDDKLENEADLGDL